MRIKKSEIVKDLSEFIQNYENIYSSQNMLKNHIILGKIAKNIIKLEQDALYLEKTTFKKKHLYHQVHHLLTSPWGAPFVAKTTFLEAAHAFSAQTHKKSDLYELLSQFKKYDKKLHHELLLLFSSILENIQS